MVWKIEIGSLVLYGIRDGGSQRDPLEFMIGSTAEGWEGQRAFLDADGMMPNTFACYLLDTGTHRVMIDTGFGYNPPPGADAGAMPDGLAALGVSPTDVDHVVFTHLHPDHILGSLTAEQTPLFPNAAHWTIEREVAHWRAGDDDRSRNIARIANVLDGAGVLHVPAAPGSIIPGVTTYPTYGHTPGHVAVRVESGGEEIVICGDVTFTPAQLDHPDWGFPFDVDKPAAAATRAAFYDDMATRGTRFLAGHFAEPGFGRIVLTADGRRYEALPVTPVT